jgi:glutathione S-transferase
LDFQAYLDGELALRPYVAGARFSVADITAVVAVDFMKPAKIAVPEGLAHLRRWHAQVSARPAVAKER